jgi:hypothetical protein
MKSPAIKWRGVQYLWRCCSPLVWTEKSSSTCSVMNTTNHETGKPLINND